MDTVLVTPELAHASAPGDLGAFAWHWSRLLRQAGDDVRIILTRPPRRPSRAWRQVYDDLGIALDVLEEPQRFIALPHGYRWSRRMAEVVYEHLPPETEIVYYAERDANAMHHLRRRRFSGEHPPVVATVLHGGSAWRMERARQWPKTLEDLERDFFERYVAAHSDWVIATNQAMLRWVERSGWALPPSERTRVAGYPFLPETARADARVSGASAADQPRAAARVRRLVCYSMPAAGEDFALFAEGVGKLAGKPCLEAVEEIVLLGSGGDGPAAVDGAIAVLRRALPGAAITARLDAMPAAAEMLLAEAAPDALVVMPCVAGGMDYAAIAATLVPGLRPLCADAGGMREVLEPAATARLFEPFPAPLARALEQMLEQTPAQEPRAAGSQLEGYAWRAANDRWLALHQEIAAQAQAVRQSGRATPRDATRAAAATLASVVPSAQAGAATAPGTTGAVDVCIPYYNLDAYLPALLEALDRQTVQDFNVFVVNDGSPDPQAVAVFEQMARTYAHHAHWRFVTTDNQGVCAARNLAASLGTAEYLCFVDADNLPLPTMIERFLTSIRQSGDDVLTCYLYTIERAGAFKPGLDLRHPPLAHYLPVGNCLPLGVFTNPFGDINCIMRRVAFEAVGGFTTDVTNAINHEDRELLTRLAFAGYRLDVIPEFLCYYRQRAASRLRTTDQYLNDARVMRVYLERLRQAGQPDLAPLAPLALGLLHGEEGYRTPAASANLLHFLAFEVSGVMLTKALAGRVFHSLRVRFNRAHRPR